MPPHPRTPLPPHLAPPAEHDPDGRATREEYDELDRLALMTSAGDHSPHGPAKSCCRSADTDARLTRMGDPTSHADGPPAVLRVSLDDGATLPTRANAGDAGLDLFALANSLPRLMPHETRVFDTGVHVEIPAGYYGQVCGRSGLAARGICPSGGVIDSSYRGPIGVVLTNHGQAQWVAEPGKAIAQLVILPIATPAVMVVEGLSETARGGRGFGSSDGK